VRRALVAVLWLSANIAQANPLDTYGFGARAIALGGAMTSSARGFAASYYNPAGIAREQPLSLEIGYAFTEPVLRINDRDLNVDQSRGFQGGITIPGEIFEHDVAVSLALHLPDGLISRVRTLPQQRPRFVLYDNRPQRLVVSTSAAVEIVDNLYFGTGLTYIAGTKGTLDVTGKVSASNSERTELFSAVEVEFSSVRYPTFGLMYEPTEGLRFGVTYRHEFVLELDLDVAVRGDIVIGEEDLIAVEDGAFILESFNTDLFSPRQLAFGASYENELFFAAIDLSWHDWSRFPPPVSAIALTLDLGNLDFDVPLPDPPLPPEFHDIWVLRLGAEWRAAESLAVRLGYVYQPSPAPAQPGLTNYVDSAKHEVSVGAGLKLGLLPEIFPRPLIFDFAVSSISLVSRDYEKEDPADVVGDYRARGTIYTVATSMSLEF
jgi:long-chain fatty acid transport protein